MKTAKQLETRTMAIIGLVQVILTTMILGIYLGPDIKIGSTPFMLLRNAMQNAPIFAMPNYLELLKDTKTVDLVPLSFYQKLKNPLYFSMNSKCKHLFWTMHTKR
jgi:cytochrome c-type biogenesis protein CcmF